jgi:CheY-like chemotaxis protein
MSDPKLILIVDDEKDSQDFLSAIVEEEGYRWRIANNGHEALEMVKADRPDLVLLDIMMPKSGVFVFKDIKKDPELRDIPIIFITGVSQQTGVDIKTGEEKPIESYSDQYPRAVGSRIYKKLQGLAPDGLIEKPVDPAVLVNKIKELL